MSAILITYQLQNPAAQLQFENYINTFKDWARLSDNSFAVFAEASDIDRINADLQKWMTVNDRVTVICLKKPFAGRMSPDTVRWLEKYLEK